MKDSLPFCKPSRSVILLSCLSNNFDVGVQNVRQNDADIIRVVLAAHEIALLLQEELRNHSLEPGPIVRESCERFCRSGPRLSFLTDTDTRPAVEFATL